MLIVQLWAWVCDAFSGYMIGHTTHGGTYVSRETSRRAMLAPAVDELRELALDYGNVRAVCIVARWYLEGSNGAPQSVQAAIDILLPYAEAGYVEAQVALVRVAQEIRDVVSPLSVAYTWTRAAAEQGHLTSIACLVEMLIVGHGCAVDPEEAALWKARQQALVARGAAVTVTSEWRERLCEFQRRLQRPFYAATGACFAYSAEAYARIIEDEQQSELHSLSNPNHAQPKYIVSEDGRRISAASADRTTNPHSIVTFGQR